MRYIITSDSISCIAVGVCHFCESVRLLPVLVLPNVYVAEGIWHLHRSDTHCAFDLCWCREIGAKRKRDAAEKAVKDEEDRKTAKER